MANYISERQATHQKKKRIFFTNAFSYHTIFPCWCECCECDKIKLWKHFRPSTLKCSLEKKVFSFRSVGASKTKVHHLCVSTVFLWKPRIINEILRKFSFLVKEIYWNFDTKVNESTTKYSISTQTYCMFGHDFCES